MPFPSDVDPVSRNRLPPLKPGVEGAAAIRLHVSSPNVRWASPLGRALTELAILITAREHDQPYEWSLHEMEALAVGLETATIGGALISRPSQEVSGVCPFFPRFSPRHGCAAPARIACTGATMRSSPAREHEETPVA